MDIVLMEESISYVLRFIFAWLVCYLMVRIIYQFSVIRDVKYIYKNLVEYDKLDLRTIVIISPILLVISIPIFGYGMYVKLKRLSYGRN